jgi:UPF0716 protein FxsA
VSGKSALFLRASADRLRRRRRRFVASAYRLTGQRVTLRSVIFLGILLFVAAEIAAFVAVAEQIGFLWALAILLVVSMLGPLVVGRVGIGVLGRTRERLARGEVPTRELLDGLVLLIGGIMLCLPGFIGDAFGLLLMIGPVRHLLIRLAGQRLARRVQTIPSGRWRVVDVPSRPVRDESRPPPVPPSRSLGPGDHDT